MGKRSLQPKKKQSAQDKYWELFACFCFLENVSGTYTELIDRVDFFNGNQTILKRVPMSATPGNACLLRFARGLFFGEPKDPPKTQLDYLYFLVSKLTSFEGWLQDNFKLYHLDSNIDYIVSLLKPFISARFRDLNPEMNKIEEQGALALGLAGFKGDLYNAAVKKLDAWRRSNPENEESFCKLHCMLDADFTPMFKPEENKDKTTESLIQAVFHAKEEGRYEFNWQGKDIAKMRVNVPEEGTFIPCPEDSVGKDGTSGKFDSQNIYIEGDNLRALKLMLEPYRGKIKMIYIDPPYNTGNKFVYKDNFSLENEIFDRLLLNPFPRIRPEDKAES